MCHRSLRVPVIIHSIANVTLFTTHDTLGVSHQPELGRTSAVFYCFRMHRLTMTLTAQKMTLYQVHSA